MIVDLGANIGCSIVLWLHRYPQAQIIAYEPLPSNYQILRWQSEINHAMQRVTLIAAAASNRAFDCFLSNAENESTVTNEFAEGRIRIKAVDFFEQMGDRQIDLLKIDIEGGEYDSFERSALR